MPQQFGNQSKSYLSAILREQLGNLDAFSYQKLTVDGTVRNLTVPTGATAALISFESSIATVAARYLETLQTTVSGTEGLGIKDGTEISILGAQNLSQFQIVQTGAGTHTLYIQYYR